MFINKILGSYGCTHVGRKNRNLQIIPLSYVSTYTCTAKFSSDKLFTDEPNIYLVIFVERAAESIERIIVFEHLPFEFKGQSPDRVFKSYEIVRKKVGRPPAFVAASRLAEAIKEGDNVIFSTGWVTPPYLPRGENDGPLGTCSLARAICIGLSGNAIFVTEKAMIPVLESVSKAAGLRVIDMKDLGTMKKMSVATVRNFPMDKDEAKREARRLLEELNPSAVITLEKAGRNEHDIYHTGLGNDFSASQAKVDYLVDEARDREILTIGIGDLGNEIGFGGVKEELKYFHPYGVKCRCPCKGGIMTVVEVEVPIYAACSNWGGYAVEACLSGILKKPEILHNSEIERRMLQAAIDAGSLDGLLQRPTMTCHAWSVEGHIHVLELMRGIIEQRLALLEGKLPPRFY